MFLFISFGGLVSLLLLLAWDFGSDQSTTAQALEHPNIVMISQMTCARMTLSTCLRRTPSSYRGVLSSRMPS
jgi:hypothetical protein